MKSSLRSLVALTVLSGIVLSGCSPSKDLQASATPPPDSSATTATTGSATAGTATTSATTAGAAAASSGPTGTPKGSLGTTGTADGAATTATTGGSGATAGATGTTAGDTKTTDSKSSVSAPDPNDVPQRAFQLASLKHAPVKVNGKTVDCWVMDTEGKRQEGMMFLTDKNVKDSQGMIFVFRDPQMKDGQHGFWMKNCDLALDIIYIAKDNKALNVQKGMPHNETSLPPAATYQSVLELKQGQAEKLGIKPGTLIEIPSDLHPTE